MASSPQTLRPTPARRRSDTGGSAAQGEVRFGSIAAEIIGTRRRPVSASHRKRTKTFDDYGLTGRQCLRRSSTDPNRQSGLFIPTKGPEVCPPGSAEALSFGDILTVGFARDFARYALAQISLPRRAALFLVAPSRHQINGELSRQVKQKSGKVPRQYAFLPFRRPPYCDPISARHPQGSPRALHDCCP